MLVLMIGAAGSYAREVALSRRTNVALTVVLLALAVAAPFVFYPVFLMKALCFALFACAFNLLIGYVGLLSFGHAAFFGTAAYITAHVVKVWGLEPLSGILLGTAAAAALGRPAGSPTWLAFQLASLPAVQWQMSAEVVLMPLLGGLGTVLGPVVGAFISITMENYLAQFGSWVTVIQGLIFVVCVLTFRRGVVGEIIELARRRRVGAAKPPSGEPVARAAAGE